MPPDAGGAATSTVWTVIGLGAGAGLSFCALGLLWVGVAWPLQFLMLPVVGLAAFVVSRFHGAAFAVPLGMLPIGALVIQFRDPAGSYAMPVALVLGWCLAAGVGIRLARRARAAPSR